MTGGRTKDVEVVRRTRRRRRTALAGVAAAAALSAACAPMPEVPPGPVTFVEHVVDASLPGAAFVVRAQVKGDARPEIVASSFVNAVGGPGRVSVYEPGATLDDWTRSDVVTPADGIRFPNEPTVGDLDGDGDADVVVTGGFFPCEFSGTPCGTLAWFEQTSGGWVRHDLVGPGSPAYHRAVLTDVDGDGVNDLVTVAETATTATTEWFRGTTSGNRFEATPRTIGSGGGALPVVADVDGDGDDDVISGEFFTGARSFVWFERQADPSPSQPAGQWADHTITAALGGGFQVTGVPDLLGDGVLRWVGTNHVNTVLNGPNPPSAAFLLTPGVDPTQPWATQPLSSGIQARVTGPGSLSPGGLAPGDVDDDGRTDLVVSGDGDDRLFWLRQEADGSFTTYAYDSGMGQAGPPVVADLDADGRVEIVSGSFEAGKIVVYDPAP